MTVVASIVEGDGEVAALPVLLRRMSGWLSPEVHAVVPPPIRVRRDRFLNRVDEFRRMLLLAAGKCGEDGWILVLLDADDDCPAELGADVLVRAQAIVPHRRLSVVLANREYESWFIAAQTSLHGRRGFSIDDHPAPDVERIRGAKEWLSAHMGGGRYRESTDQPAFSSLIDLDEARANSRSFRKLCDEWLRFVAAVGMDAQD